ncbi:phage tail domain-containing protein [Heyndrickxia sporothermodurans]|uniref:phage tail domain-containing protein n=1 Tax=Heyndrickxia sporothermodurans TaxID=46224 RepID=UPI002E1C229A|nr:phage tail family protein [Heyndrickxia sporothermodurans]MED3697934.1 phage tail family protein [Heyndrickxia sporothermodurans]
MSEASVWIDDVELQSLGVTVRLGSTEPMLPSLREQTLTVPGRHGAYDFGAYLEPREFELDCVFPRQSYVDLKLQIRSFLGMFLDAYGRPKTVKLRFGDELDKYYNVRVSGTIPIERLANLGQFTLPLTAYDPFGYSVRSSEETLTWGDTVVTFEWNYLLGNDLGGGGQTVQITSAQTRQLYVDGSMVRPTFVLKGAGKSVKISANGKSFTIADLGGATWTIDGGNYSVLKDGSNALGQMTGDFVELISGNNNVAISGTALNFALTVKYRDKYV